MTDHIFHAKFISAHSFDTKSPLPTAWRMENRLVFLAGIFLFFFCRFSSEDKILNIFSCVKPNPPDLPEKYHGWIAQKRGTDGENTEIRGLIRLFSRILLGKEMMNCGHIFGRHYNRTVELKKV